MNNKGFTLIELIVVIALVLVFAGIFSVNMTKGLQSQNEENKSKMISDLATAADAYIYSNTEDLFNNEKTIKIETEDLVEEGFLKNKEGYLEYICATKDDEGLITFDESGCECEK